MPDNPLTQAEIEHWRGELQEACASEDVMDVIGTLCDMALAQAQSARVTEEMVDAGLTSLTWPSNADTRKLVNDFYLAMLAAAPAHGEKEAWHDDPNKPPSGDDRDRT